MSTIIIDAFGVKRLATPEEQARLDAEQQEIDIRNFHINVAAIKSVQENQKFRRLMTRKGVVPNHTRSTYGWRLRERRGSLGRLVPADFTTPPNGLPGHSEVDYVLPGHSGHFDFQPRLRVTNDEMYEAWAKRKINGKEEFRLLRSGFKRSCEEGRCNKSTCAMCWAINHAQIKKDETIVIRWRDMHETRKVSDPSGVNPHGKRNSSAQSLGEDQRAIFRLSSTIHAHKPGASGWE